VHAPTFGVEAHDCAARHRAYLTGMDPTSTGSTLWGWRRNYVGAYIMESNGHEVFNSLDFSTICALVHKEHLMVHHPKLSLIFTPERKESLRDPIVSPHLHLDQFRPVIHILSGIGESNTLSDAELPDDDELISTIHSVADQGCSSPMPPPLPHLQDSDPNYEIGTQPGYKLT
jgi:hypothetical protein